MAMKICNMCENLSTELLTSIRDNINSVLEVRSQEIMKQSLPPSEIKECPRKGGAVKTHSVKRHGK